VSEWMLVSVKKDGGGWSFITYGCISTINLNNNNDIVEAVEHTICVWTRYRWWLLGGFIIRSYGEGCLYGERR
jgi:hypothetical protein